MNKNYTLVLDLDETLVHYEEVSLDLIINFNFNYPIV